jgi:hypothetical protein
MRNITLAIDDDTYRKIRLWCAMRDISISHVVKVFLRDLPRLEQVRRFPLPEAPEPHSLAAAFDRLLPRNSKSSTRNSEKSIPLPDSPVKL